MHQISDVERPSRIRQKLWPHSHAWFLYSHVIWCCVMWCYSMAYQMCLVTLPFFLFYSYHRLIRTHNWSPKFYAAIKASVVTSWATTEANYFQQNEDDNDIYRNTQRMDSIGGKNKHGNRHMNVDLLPPCTVYWCAFVYNHNSSYKKNRPQKNKRNEQEKK